MSRIIHMLAATAVACGLALAGLLTATAGAASAATPGTTGPGSWFLDQGDGNNAIKTTTSASTSSYTAQVQQPINAPGQIPSIFSTKNARTIPVKYQVSKCTTPGASSTVYPDNLESDLGGSGIGSYGNLMWNAPSGLTVGQVTNLTANFQWVQGQNQAGSMRWVINTSAGNVDVYYGEPFNTGAGTVDSGVNMITDPTNTGRVDTWPGNNTNYDTWQNNVLNNPAVANEPVNWIGLVVDSGYAGTEQVQLSSAGVQITAGSDNVTYTPGTVSSGGGSPTCAPDTTDNFWLSISKTSGATPAGPVNESLVDNTQGDTGGQFRQAGGFYMYNLPLSQLTDLTATYTIGISPNSDGSNPVGLVTFGLK